MHYRAHEGGPLTSIAIAPGAVIVTMYFDEPGCHTRLHSHAFDHWMECVAGSARIEIEGVVTTVRPGDRYVVAAHQRHGVWPLELDTVLRCVHEHADIQPDLHDGIPIEWLGRLTDRVPQ